MFRSESSSTSLKRVFKNSDINSITPNLLRKSVSDVSSLLALHSIHIDESEEEIVAITSQFQGPLEAFAYASNFKEEGNLLFKAKNFISALSCYKKAIILVTLSVPLICEESNLCDSLPECGGLVVSLHLNMAFCELKLDNLDNAIHFSSLVLRVDKANVKARFRRGLAYVKLGRFVKAIKDFKQALVLDPKNKDIQLELSKVEGAFTLVGSNIALSQKKRKTADGLPCPVANGLNESTCSYNAENESKTTSSHILTVGKCTLAEEDTRVKQSKVHFETSICHNLGKEENERLCCDSPSPKRQGNKDASHGSRSQRDSCCDLSVKEADIELSSEMEVESKNSSIDNNPPSRKSPSISKVTFINKKRKNTSLRLSREDVEKLGNGKELQYYNSRSGFFLKVRQLEILHPVNLDVKMEAHHNKELRVAEVSEYEVCSSNSRSVASSSNHNIILNDAKHNSKISSDEVCSSCISGVDTPRDDSPIVEKTCRPSLFCLNRLGGSPFNVCFQKGISGKNSSRFSAALKARIRAIRYARQRSKTQTSVQFQHMHKVRKRYSPPTQHSESLVTGKNFPKVGLKRKFLGPYEMLEEDHGKQKQPRISVELDGDCCFYSRLFVSSVKLAQDIVGQASFML